MYFASIRIMLCWRSKLPSSNFKTLKYLIVFVLGFDFFFFLSFLLILFTP